MAGGSLFIDKQVKKMPHARRVKLITFSGVGGWTFAPVPVQFAPPFKLAWGRTPVIATVDGKEWKTSVWTDKTGQVLLPVPKKIRGAKGQGDLVVISIKYSERQ